MQTPDSRAGLNVSGITVYPEGQSLGAVPFGDGLHLAIGMFDGVHVGHQAVIKSSIRTSRKDPGSSSGVLTFDPHPSRILNLQGATDLIMSLPARVGHMLSLGLDRVFVQEFTKDYASVEASQFVRNLVGTFPCLKSLHVGANFRFGARRSGTVDTLRKSAEEAGLGIFIVERQVDSGEPISSSRIRRDLARGDIEKVNAMLGYPYEISGKVVEGRKIGRTIGFPTLNVQWHPEALPRFGVYKAWLLSGKSGFSQAAVANYGLRPTVSGGEDPLLEVHLLDPEHVPLPGSHISVALTRFIRPEKAFSSIEALRSQISEDVVRVLEIQDSGAEFSSVEG